jgi:hypothetical protein
MQDRITVRARLAAPPRLPTTTWAASVAEGQASGGKIVAEYDYFDHITGELLMQVVRYEPKGFSQRRPDPTAPANGPEPSPPNAAPSTTLPAPTTPRASC